MTSKPKSSRTKSPKTTQSDPSKPPRRGRPPGKANKLPSKSFSPEQKAQAILAVWTEKISQMDISRQMQVSYITLERWQERAMDGMLRALDDKSSMEDPTLLSPRLRKMMQRGLNGPQTRVGRRLAQIQQERDNNPPV